MAVRAQAYSATALSAQSSSVLVPFGRIATPGWETQLLIGHYVWLLRNTGQPGSGAESGPGLGVSLVEGPLPAREVLGVIELLAAAPLAVPGGVLAPPRLVAVPLVGSFQARRVIAAAGIRARRRGAAEGAVRALLAFGGVAGAGVVRPVASRGAFVIPLSLSLVAPAEDVRPALFVAVARPVGVNARGAVREALRVVAISGALPSGAAFVDELVVLDAGGHPAVIRVFAVLPIRTVVWVGIAGIGPRALLLPTAGVFYGGPRAASGRVVAIAGSLEAVRFLTALDLTASCEAGQLTELIQPVGRG